MACGHGSKAFRPYPSSQAMGRWARSMESEISPSPGNLPLIAQDLQARGNRRIRTAFRGLLLSPFISWRAVYAAVLTVKVLLH